MGRRSSSSRHRRRWSQRDVDLLIWLWGTNDIRRVAQQLGRSEIAIYGKARALGLCARFEGYVSLKQLMERSGFWKRAVLTAMRRVGVELHVKKRVSPHEPHESADSVRYAFTLEEAELVLAELKKHAGKNRIVMSFKGEWGTGKKPAACLGCGRSDRPHRMHGLCTACAIRSQRPKKTPIVPPGHMAWQTVRKLARRAPDTLAIIAERAGVEVMRNGLVRYVRDEDVDRLIEAARASGRFISTTTWPEWGRPRRPPACVCCERTDRRYASKGLCVACDSRVRRAEKRAVRDDTPS